MILKETLVVLRDHGLLTDRTVRVTYLTPYFTVVELDDGSVGAAMSYYGPPDDLVASAPQATDDDPLLLRWAFAAAPSSVTSPNRYRLLQLSIATAVVGALSAASIRDGGDETFSTTDTLPFDPFAEARRAVVVGFGGYMPLMAAAPGIQSLHVCDLGYQARRAFMDEELDRLRAANPKKLITISDGADIISRVGEADLLSITGSALCNGSMERILDAASQSARVIVQGQSASLHPAALFARGVWFVATTLKPAGLVQAAATDPNGNSLRTYLEGGLNRLYFLPRNKANYPGEATVTSTREARYEC